MTAVLAGPVLAAALLQGAAGVAKVARPDDTARALRRAGWRVDPATVRAGAAVEVLVAASAATVGGAWPAAALGASYLLLAAFVTAALARGWPLSSCGCFGEPDTPPTVLHAVLDAACAAAALLAAAGGGAAPLERAVRRPGWGAALVLGALAVAGLGYLALAEWPRVRAEMGR